MLPSGDFESPASTIPPLGRTKGRVRQSGGGVQDMTHMLRRFSTRKSVRNRWHCENASFSVTHSLRQKSVSPALGMRCQIPCHGECPLHMRSLVFFQSRRTTILLSLHLGQPALILDEGHQPGRIGEFVVVELDRRATSARYPTARCQPFLHSALDPHDQQQRVHFFRGSLPKRSISSAAKPFQLDLESSGPTGAGTAQGAHPDPARNLRGSAQARQG